MIAIAAPPADELTAALALDVDGSFERLVLAYRGTIVSFVGRMLHDDARAEDVAQDVFVRAYRALKTYSPERRAEVRLPSWLYAIAHNLTRNAVRDAPAPTESLDYDDGEPRSFISDVGGTPELAVLGAERRDTVARAIETLSPRLRPAFVLRYVEEMSYDEIAGILDQPVGTVKASAHRARAALRALLENDDD
ncbi:MAG: RNA polymerase sigma factor [Candidatus Velthaea sp.]